MKFKFVFAAIGSLLMIGLFTTQVMAAEILTVEDFRQKIVSEENLGTKHVFSKPRLYFWSV
jgi:hypothetical protein